VNQAVPEAALVKQLELQADVVRQRLLAASHHDGRHEQVQLVDQPRFERMGGEIGPGDGEVTLRRLLQLQNRSGSKSRSIRVLAVETVSSVFA
jgi:hypothetical protein